MTVLIRALRAETLKLNRTLALVLVVVGPLAVNFLLFLTIMRNSTALQNAWDLVTHSILFVWTIMMMPLFVALETALLGGLDHNANSWKHLYALPIPRWTIYAAKQIIAFGVMFVSAMIQCVGAWLTGMVVQVFHLKPLLNFGVPFPWATVLTAAALSYLASWMIIAIQMWLALRWASFPLAIGVGITAVVAGLWGANNQDWAYFFPWSFPHLVLEHYLDNGTLLLSTLLAGLIGGVIIAVIGGWLVTRRDVL